MLELFTIVPISNWGSIYLLVSNRDPYEPLELQKIICVLKSVSYPLRVPAEPEHKDTLVESAQEPYHPLNDEHLEYHIEDVQEFHEPWPRFFIHLAGRWTLFIPPVRFWKEKFLIQQRHIQCSRLLMKMSEKSLFFFL